MKSNKLSSANVRRFESLLESVDEDDLKAELARRAKIRAEQKDEEDRLYSIEMFKSVDTLLVVAKHSRFSCSDQNPCNPYADSGAYDCPRCALLEIRENHHWPADVSYDVSLSRKI